MPNKEDQELVRKLASYQENKQLSDRETALRGAKPVSFEHLKGMIGDRLNSARLEFQRGGAPDKSAAAGAPGKGVLTFRDCFSSGHWLTVCIVFALSKTARSVGFSMCWLHC